MIGNSRAFVQKEPRNLNKKNPGKTYLPRFLDQTDTESLKASIDRELADISMYMEQERQLVSKIVPGSDFKGTWDACTDKYPDHGDKDSTWDVIVTCGATHTFDGKTWETGHQLLYLAASQTFIQRTNPGVEGLKHEVDELKIKVDNAEASIVTNQTAIAETNLALAEESKKLTAAIGSNTANIAQTNQVVATLTDTVATNKTELESKINENTSKIAITNTTVANLEKTVATNVTELRAEYKAADSKVASDAAADAEAKDEEVARVAAAQLAITNQTVADNKQAAASATTALKAEMDGNIANINSQMSTVVNKVGTLESKWTVQADVNGKISGIEMVNDGRTSEFTILTDKFKVTDGTSSIPPFVIEGGKVTMRDVKVYGHIEAASGKFTGTVESSHIRGGDLNIGNGQAVIDPNGYAVFNNANIRGNITGTGGTFSNITITDSCNIQGSVYADKIVGDLVSISEVWYPYNEARLGINQWATLGGATIVSSTNYDRYFYDAIPKIDALYSTELQSGVIIRIVIGGRILLERSSTLSGGSGVTAFSTPTVVVPAGVSGRMEIVVGHVRVHSEGHSVTFKISGSTQRAISCRLSNAIVS